MPEVESPETVYRSIDHDEWGASANWGERSHRIPRLFAATGIGFVAASSQW